MQLNPLALLSLSTLACLPIFAEDPIPLDPGVGGMSIDATALQPGDIIVSTTTAAISKAIQSATGSPVSHTLVYVRQVLGKPQVIEAVGSGVREVSLEAALSDASLAVAFRHPERTDLSVEKLKAYLLSQVGKSYDKWGIAQQLLCRKAGKLCKVSTHDDKWYCSELVVTAFGEAGMELAVKNVDWKAPGDIAELSATKTLEYVGHLLAP